MIDGMFQAGTDQALDDQNKRLRVAPPQPPAFSFGDLAKAPFQGIGSGIAKSLAFGAEITGAFGDVLGAYPEAMDGITPLTDEQKQQAEAARRKLIDVGPGYSNDVGDAFRARAKDIMPDPASTHVSAQVVAGLGDFMTQAVGYGLTLGPAGPLALAGDVGFTEADRLKQQGVDLPTRAKAGAVAGAVAGVSVVVPMSGATALTRAAKGVAVGEGGLIGQSLAEKAILKAGGYDQIADTFDPLDPVSLGLGLVPGVLGAKFGHAAPRALPPGAKPITDMGLAERQALKFDDVRLDAYAVQAAQRQGIPPEVLLAVKNAGEKSNSGQTSPKGAQGVMQFMPKTFKEFGKGDATDPINSIDAGAAYLKKLHDAYGDWDAAVAHYNGGGAQAALVRGGARPSIPETAAYLDRVKAYLGKTVDNHATAAVKAQPELVDAARVSQAAAAIESSRLTAADDLPGRDAHVAAVETAADQIARGEPVSVPAPIIEPPRPAPPILDWTAALDSARAAGHRIEWMSPQQYLDLSPEMNANPGKLQRLRDAAASEEPLRELPSLTVEANPDGTGGVIAQEGRHRATLYQEAGVREMPVFLGQTGPKVEMRSFRGQDRDTVYQPRLSPLPRVDSLPALPNLQVGDAASFALRNGERVMIERTVDRASGVSNPNAPAAGPVPSEFIVRDAGGERIGAMSFVEGGTAIDVGIDAAHQRKGIGTLLYDLAEASGAKIPPPLETTSPAALALRASRAARDARAAAPARLAAAVEEVRRVRDQARQPQDTTRAPTAPEAARSETAAPARSATAEAPAGLPAARGTGDAQAALAEPIAQATVDRAAAEVSMLNPDLLVQLDGMDAPARVGDLLAKVKEEAARDATDAQLVQAAVECALRN